MVLLRRVTAQNKRERKRIMEKAEIYNMFKTEEIAALSSVMYSNTANKYNLMTFK